MFSVIIFIVILSILVLIHEFGHYYVAKRNKIGVEEFGFGLPPRIWGKQVNGTIYSINWLPFGGFVKLVGEDSTDADAKTKGSFQTKSLFVRMQVLLAGVFLNFILAVILFYLLILLMNFRVTLPALFYHKFSFVDQSSQVLVSDVAEGSIAQKAGIKVGDSIYAVEQTPISSIDQLQKFVRSSEGKEINLSIENVIDNQKRNVSLTPEYNQNVKAPAIGVGLGELVVLNYRTFAQRMFSGFSYSFDTTVYSFEALGKIIGYSVQSHDFEPVSEAVSGPVGIAQMTAQAVSLGWQPVLQLVALLSLNLAVMNVLPIPALDGGRFFFLVIEAVTRKKVNQNVEKWAHTIGFAVLIGLIILISYNDIIKIIK